jgi:hypothetical protein
MTTGRRDATELLIHDAPNATVEAMLDNQDKIIDLLTTLLAKLDSDTGVNNEDYHELKGSLDKLNLTL